MVKRGRPQMTIWRMRIACLVPKATNTHTLTLCNTYCFSTTTTVARTRPNVTLYVRCVYCPSKISIGFILWEFSGNFFFFYFSSLLKCVLVIYLSTVRIAIN
jgi:hypothetical protein